VIGQLAVLEDLVSLKWLRQKTHKKQLMRFMAMNSWDVLSL
jgi:hypothetical protein